MPGNRPPAPDALEGIARYLHGAGLARFGADGVGGVGGDLFIEQLPTAPDLAVGLWLYGGLEPDSRVQHDAPRLQVRCRGTADPRPSRHRAAAISAELHGLGPIVLPGGAVLTLCTAVQSAPHPLGPDAQGRHEHVVNFQLHLLAPQRRP